MGEIWKRLLDHDKSKLAEPELSGFTRNFATLSKAEYGTPAYAEQMARLREALTHHYTHNRHHPEHHAEGIAGMTLVDLIEMVCDWMAATSYGPNGHIDKSIAFNQKRFAIGDQLTAVIKNTAQWLRECAASAARRYAIPDDQGGEHAEKNPQDDAA
jgi:hypothetical protein